jgi:hypothetical protein
MGGFLALKLSYNKMWGEISPHMPSHKKIFNLIVKPILIFKIL